MDSLLENHVVPKEIISQLAKNYKNLELLGDGGFGVIISGESKQKDRKIAIKVVKFTERFRRKEFQQEVKMIKTLGKHQNICCLEKTNQRVYKFKEPEKHTYGVYTMERMDCDLLEYMLNTPLSSKLKIQFIFKSICKAVQHCHSKGIAHLDLKPDNVLMKLIGRTIVDVKLCDFGSAKKLRSFNGNFIPEIHDSVNFGTKQYLPPECMELFNPLKPLCYDKVDIYALGVILYIITTNQFPKLYSEDGEKNLLIVADMNNLRQIVSEECYDLIISLMDDSPHLRPSINEVLDHPFLQF